MRTTSMALAVMAFNIAALYVTLGFRQFSHYFTAIRLALRDEDLPRARERKTSTVFAMPGVIAAAACTRTAAAPPPPNGVPLNQRTCGLPRTESSFSSSTCSMS